MSEQNPLERLARLYGVETSYRDIGGRLQSVPRETTQAILEAMGVPAGTEKDLATGLQRALEEGWQQALPPAVVGTAAQAIEVPLNLPATLADAPLVWTVTTEDGDQRRGEILIAELPLREVATLAGRQLERRCLALPGNLPEGYHRLAVQSGRRGASELQVSCRLILCPDHCVTPDEALHDGRTWGFALQLYGLRSARNWGMGDFADLAEIAERTAGLGADLLGINPLHALFPADPGHFGPYGPSNRQFLNVLYIRPELAPGFDEDPEVKALLADSAFRQRLDQVRRSELIDYPEVSALKLPVLERLYRGFRDRHLGGSGSPLARSFRAFCREMGQALEEHARFDALHEHFFRRDPAKWSWATWPEAYRDAKSPEVARFAEQHADRVGFFKYLQWLADGQLGAAQARARDAGMRVGLYGDLAVAAHPGGSMAWRSPQIVLSGIGVGAPPDAFNMSGQNWGLAALSPRGLRNAAYEPFAAIVRANMRHAGALRIDHVMGLTRQFWVPDGASAATGGYVTYPLKDLLGIVALESRRNRCLVIGEDLGTVPEGFRDTMAEAGILTYRVLYFEREPDQRFTPPAGYPPLSLVTATTHDLPPLTGFWQGRDLDWRRRLGMFADEASSLAAITERTRDRALLVEALQASGQLSEAGAPPGGDGEITAELIAAIYGFLASSPGALLMVSLEDVMMDLEQANLPGTFDQHPNWRRKLSQPIEKLFDLPALKRIIEAIVRERRIEGERRRASGAP